MLLILWYIILLLFSYSIPVPLGLRGVMRASSEKKKSITPNPQRE